MVACDQMGEVEASLPCSQTLILIDPLQIESPNQRNLLGRLVTALEKRV